MPSDPLYLSLYPSPPTTHRAQQQEAQRGRSDEAKRKEREREALKAKKEAEARFKAEKEALFQPVHIDQRAPFGTDPKNIVCINFKNGHCKNGNRCKFSHDLNAGRKVEKKDLYTDTRDGPEGSAEGKDGKKEGECNPFFDFVFRQIPGDIPRSYQSGTCICSFMFCLLQTQWKIGRKRNFVKS